jgi:hypothetical protein
VTVFLRRNDDTCLWLSSGDVVSCSYGKVGSAAMKTYAVVPVEVAESQIQAHLDHGWFAVGGVTCPFYPPP